MFSLGTVGIQRVGILRMLRETTGAVLSQDTNRGKPTRGHILGRLP